MIPKRTRRLRARATTMNTHEAEFEDYGPEPNMKLSHAFLVVLMLHVIAVGGLYAFNSLKANKAAKAQASKTIPMAKVPAPADPAPEPSANRGPDAGEPKNQPPQEKSPALVAKPSEGAKALRMNEVPASKGLATSQSLLGKAAALVAGVSAGSTTKLRAQNASPATPEVPAAAPVPTTYTVVAGDSMTRIASKLGVAIPELEKVNGLTGSSVLQVGQVLKVPEKSVQTAGEVAGTQVPAPSPDAPQAVTNGAQPVSTAGMTEYTVVKGDNPYKIAKRFKVGFEELMKVNNISDPKKIQIGQKLLIPTAGKKGSK